MRADRRRLRRCLAWLVALWLVPGIASAQRYDPALQFRTITTPHFWVHFHSGEESTAERVAVLAEEVRAKLLIGRLPPEPSRTHLILSGQDDVPNGWATTAPFNVIELRTVLPRPSASVGNSDDWLRLVLTHEVLALYFISSARVGS